MRTAERLELNLWEKRLCADELLSELRRGTWRKLPPALLLEPPSFEMPGTMGSSSARYLYTLLPHNAYLETRDLEISIMRSDFDDAIYEIDGLGYGEEWRAFFQGKVRLYWVEDSRVRQNPRTSANLRRAMGCIFKRAVVRPWDGVSGLVKVCENC